ncbi:MAG: DNA translocase FtsK 4TM domain-containing protein, partial [Phycisphaerales bacterium]|nr:DNA translocase FtsK 4TM domain-containing protein [Phycisphaerales bacterium]
MAEESRRSQILKNCRLVGGVVFCAFAWMSILTFSDLDWPNQAVWPHPAPAFNACGKAGAWFAFQFIHYLGVGV